MLRSEYGQDTVGIRKLRLGQKVALGYKIAEDLVAADEPKDPSRRETEGDLMPVLQMIFDLLVREPEIEDRVKERVAVILARCYLEKEPGFTLQDAYQAIVREYGPGREGEEEVKAEPSPPGGGMAGKPEVRRRKKRAYPHPPAPPLGGKGGRTKRGKR